MMLGMFIEMNKLKKNPLSALALALYTLTDFLNQNYAHLHTHKHTYVYTHITKARTSIHQHYQLVRKCNIADTYIYTYTKKRTHLCMCKQTC